MRSSGRSREGSFPGNTISTEAPTGSQGLRWLLLTHTAGTGMAGGAHTSPQALPGLLLKQNRSEI